MNEIKVRKARLEDLETLLQFEQGVIAAERPFDETLKDGHIRYYDLAALIKSPEAEVVVAELDGHLIGSGYARMERSKPYNKHTHHAYLGFMYVLPAHRGKGINGAIIHALKTWALSKGITESRLDVYDQNKTAIRAYEKVGFKKLLVNMRMGLGNDG
jgi:GNAT superfamily N-acetyltransferase